MAVQKSRSDSSTGRKNGGNNKNASSCASRVIAVTASVLACAGTALPYTRAGGSRRCVRGEEGAGHVTG